MNARGRLLLAILVVCMLVSVVLPGVNGEIFDIGEELESEINSNNHQSYDSGVVIQYGFSNISRILDGNLSTGIDEIWPGVGNWWCRIYFHGGLFINNITYKPNFGGKSSNYDSDIMSENSLMLEIDNESAERTVYLNCSITAFTFRIHENGPNQFYFNDIIIDYDPQLSNWSELQVQFNDLNQQINSLNNQINNLNNTIIALSQTQNQILQNITDLWSFYNQLNTIIINAIDTIEALNTSSSENITQIQNDLILIEADIIDIYQTLDNSTVNITDIWSTLNQLDVSILNILDEIENLNITTNDNITQMKNELTQIMNDITDIYLSLDNLTANASQISNIQDLIDQANQDIYYLNENITEIKSSIPTEYNDTAMSNRVLQLESENSAMSIEIENLKTEIDEIKDSQDEPADPVVYGSFITSFLGIIIAIVAVILASRKIGDKTPSEEEDTKASEEDS